MENVAKPALKKIYELKINNILNVPLTIRPLNKLFNKSSKPSAIHKRKYSTSYIWEGPASQPQSTLSRWENFPS